MSKRTQLTKDVNAWPDTEKVRYIVDDLMKKEDKKLDAKTRARDVKGAQDEMSGIDIARLFEMPTLLDDEVRTVDDDGSVDWKSRDEASAKDHHLNNDYWEGVYTTAAGIRRRRDDRLKGWQADNPSYNPADPIGPFLFRDVHCAICKKGWRPNDPFEFAHDVAATLGGGDCEFAHRSCNRAEGVG